MIRLPHDRRLRMLAFIVINLSAASLLYLALVAPVLDYLKDGRATLDLQREFLERTMKATAQATAIAAVAPREGERDAFPGANEGAANAALQAKLKGIAESSSVSLRSVRSLSIKSVERLQMMGARLEISGSLPAIRRLIYGIEGASPSMFVSTAIIRSAHLARTDRADEPMLDAQFDVFAALTGRPAP